MTNSIATVEAAAPMEAREHREHALQGQHKDRLLSIDVFRGLTILIMLLVNNIGRGRFVPNELHHAMWNDHISIADLAFPWFIFVVGMAIPFSAASFKKKGLPVWKYDLRVLRRALLLIGLGCLLHSVDIGRAVITMGVLQLIGIDYAIAALIYDLPAQRRAGLSVILLVGYWAAIKYIPVPGVGTGVFEEGRNLIEHINSAYLRSVRVEGLPVVIPTLALALIGTLVGDFIRHIGIDKPRKAIWLMGSGTVLLAISMAWRLSLAFNKPLWTSPFILFTAGAGIAVFGVLYWVLDVKNQRKWSFPLAVFGVNALPAYVLPILFKYTVLRPLEISTTGWPRVIIFIGCWWAFCWVLYRKRWFIKV